MSKKVLSFMSTIRLETFFGWTICALLFMSPFMVNRSLVDYANLPQAVFIQTGALIFLVSASVNLVATGHVRLTRNPVTYGVLLFLLWVLLSLLWARNAYEGLLVSVHFISCGIVFFIIANVFQSIEWSRRTLLAIVIAGTGVALLGWGQQLFKMSWIPQQVPPAATFGNKNVASQVVSMVLPILPVYFFLASAKSKAVVTRWVTSLMAFILIGYLLFSETRAAWLATTLSLFLVTMALIRDGGAKDSLVRICRKTLCRILLLSVASLMAVAIFSPKSVEDLLSMSRHKVVSSISRRGSVHIRLKMWRNGLEMFKDRPILGCGIGNFKVYYPLYHERAVMDPAFSEQKRPLNIHNDLLQAAIELGSVGFLLLAGLLALTLRMAYRLTGHDQPPEVRLVSIGTGGGIVSMVVTGMFSFPMERSVPPLILVTYMGILAASYNRHVLSNKTVSFSVGPTITLPVCVLAVAATLMMTRFNYGLLVSDAHYGRALKMARIGVWPEAIHSGLKSYESNPQKMAALEAVGWAYVESNELDKGIETLNRVLRAYPYNIKAMGKLGDAYYKGGNHQKAFETFERLIKIKSDSPHVLGLMGNICIKEGRHDDALRYFEQAITHDQDNPFLYANLGFVKFKLKKYSEAAKEYEKALTYRPDMLYSHKSLASIYGSYIKDPEKASYHTKRCLEIGGNDCRPEGLRGDVDMAEPSPRQRE